jgi:hypothetical protein
VILYYCISYFDGGFMSDDSILYRNLNAIATTLQSIQEELKKIREIMEQAKKTNQ